MIPDNQKTSLLIASQLPGFIRDDPNYNKFVLFLEAYFQWLEVTGNVTERIRNVPSYVDIDKTSAEFLTHFYNEILPFFPEDILADKVKVAKVAKEMYQAKGTEASFRFLFRVLFNSDIDFFYTKDVILRASAGKWYVARSLRLATTDLNFLNINNLRAFGETSKSIATIENTVLSTNKIEVFISNIERLFRSGEIIRIVDSNNRDVLFNGQPLRAKLVGQISSVKINPKNRGSLYQVGDPVILYGGLETPSGHGAIAHISETTTGSIQRIVTAAGGFGYEMPSPNTPNTVIFITGGGGAQAEVGGVNIAPNNTANVTMVPNDVISLATTSNIVIGNSSNHVAYTFLAGNANSNFDSPLANAFAMQQFFAYPISSVIVKNSGGGIVVLPAIKAVTFANTQFSIGNSDLSTYGILAPIQIITGGTGYAPNDKINIIGGTGFGAAANVRNVNGTGAIVNVWYVNANNQFPGYPLGGLGHQHASLPTLTITSANGVNGSLVITEILGEGAKFTPVTDRIGTITSIAVDDFGEDYISVPLVSLKVQDIVVNNLSNTMPSIGDTVYQGSTFNTATYVATVNSISSLVQNAIIPSSLWKLRTYEYSSVPNFILPLKIVDKPTISMNLSNQFIPLIPDARYDSNTGILVYGDGSAKATAIFLDGLTISSGQSLDDTGQPSSFDILQSENFNNYTYEISVHKEIDNYRTMLLNMLHPAGMKVLGRYIIDFSGNTAVVANNTMHQGKQLKDYTGSLFSYTSMTTDFSNQNTNLVTFSDLNGANIGNVFVANTSTLTLSTDAISAGIRNYLEATQEFEHSVWQPSNLTFTPNITLAPDGTMTADKSEITATAAALSAQGFTAPAGGMIYSIYCKKGSGATDGQEFGIWNITRGASIGFAVVNYDTGAVIGSAGMGMRFEAVGNGWFRLSLSYPAGFNHTAGDTVQCYPGWIGNVYTAGKYVYLWGAQVSAGRILLPYVAATANVTNKLIFTKNFDNASWIKDNQVVTANVAIAPDQTVTMDRVVRTGPGVANWIGLMQIFAENPLGKTYNFSIWLQTDTGNANVNIGISDVDVVSDVSTIVINTTPTRYNVTSVVAFANTGRVSGGISVLANGVNVFAWGAQLTDTKSEKLYVDTQYIHIKPTTDTVLGGDVVSGLIVGVNVSANQTTFQNNTWLTFANVANIVAAYGYSNINITSLTGSYNIINNGIYSNTDYPLKDIVRAGDTVLIANNGPRAVVSVDYINNIINISSPLTDKANSFLSVQRTTIASGNSVTIFG